MPYDYSPGNLAKLEEERGLPSGMLLAIHYAENSSDTAVSPKGAMGEFQVLPTTARQPGYGVQPFNPRDPVGVADYVKALYDRSGRDPMKTAAAYNAGLGGNFNNPETQKYIQRFSSHMEDNAPVQVQLADGRTLQFPAGTSREVIMKAAKRYITPQETSQEPEQLSQRQLAAGAISDIMESGSAPTASIIKGVTGIPQIIANAGVGAANLATPSINKAFGTNIPQMPSSTEALGQVLSKLGFPGPKNGAEKVSDIGVQILSGGFTGSAEQAALESVIGKVPAKVIAPDVQAARAAGYKVPPTQIRPTLANRMIEGLSGRDQMARVASVKNQPLTNQLAAKALGLPENKQLTKAAIDEVIKTAGKSYEQVKSINRPILATLSYLRGVSKLGKNFEDAAKEFPDLINNKEVEALKDSLSKGEMSPRAAVDLVRKLRFDASSNLKNYTSPEKMALGYAQRDAADLVDGLIESNLRNYGNVNLYRDYIAARTQLAKAHNIKDALDDASGNVSAAFLGRLLAKGRPLTDELRTIGRFANAFPQASKEAQKIGSQPGFSPLDFWAGLAKGALTAGARPAARQVALSKAGQNFAAGVPDSAMAALLGAGAPLLTPGTEEGQ